MTGGMRGADGAAPLSRSASARRPSALRAAPNEPAAGAPDLPPPAELAAELPAELPAAVPAHAGDGRLERMIAVQVRAYRRAAGISGGELARRIGMSKAMLSKIENAQTSCSLSTLGRLAEALDVPVTALFRGVDVEREAVFVRAGHGAEIVRQGTRVGHHYQLLGTLRGVHKRMEPILVTLTEASEVFPLFQHPGTEFLYMLEGALAYGHGQSTYVLRPGDALQFDGEGPHGPVELIDLPIRFLSIIAYGLLPE